MVRQIVFHVIVLGTLALAACNGHSQAPTPLASPQATAPPPAPPALPPPAGSNSIAGLYALTLTLGSQCGVVPDAERTRHYTARIDHTGGGRYVVTVSDGRFLTGTICTAGGGEFTGIRCDQFFVSQDGDTVEFSLINNNDNARGGHITEQLSSGGWLEIIGSARGRVDGSSIEASGTSSVWYCPTPSLPFPCANSATCESTLRLTLSRR